MKGRRRAARRAGALACSAFAAGLLAIAADAGGPPPTAPVGSIAAGAGAAENIESESAAAPPPPLATLLARVGLRGRDLRLGADADWLGNPSAGSVPHLLPHVAEVAREPQRLVALGANWLAVARRAAAAVGGERDLLPLVTAYGLQPRQPGFRGFAVPLPELPDGPAPEGLLTAVLVRLAEPAAHSPGPAIAGAPAVAPPWPTAGGEERALPSPLRRPVAELLLALDDAGRRVVRSWHRLPAATVASAVADEIDLRLLPGGEAWWPALDDAARAGDDVDRAAALLLVVAALQRAIPAFEAVGSPSGFDRWEAATPWGRIVVAGDGSHRHRCAADCLLIVDLGGADAYEGSAGAAVFPGQSVAVVLDLGGEDEYRASVAAQGAGLGAVGVLADLGGDDLYTAGDRAQGFGLLGYGLLWDGGGDDRYRAAEGAQGAALFGGGLLVDLAGGDDYRLLGDGQGFGGPGACGVVADLAGDDVYTAERDAAAAPGRADYHTEGRVATSNAQGAGVGRRGDLTDGHSWAGGVGALVDLAGDDVYSAGDFAQAAGFWYGTGLLLDAGGDDLYRSVYFSQASGAHFSLALLWDGGGADRHLLEGDDAGAGLGYGWDFAVSLLVDAGGDDRYRSRRTGLGAAERSSLGLLLELGGDDVYDLPAAARSTLGAAAGGRRRPREAGDPVRAADLAAEVGLFLDLGGADRYPADHPCGAENGRVWHCVRRPVDDPPGRAPRLGAGLDVDATPPADPVGWLLDLD